MTDIFAFSYTQTLKGKGMNKNLLLYDSVVNEEKKSISNISLCGGGHYISPIITVVLLGLFVSNKKIDMRI